MPQSNHADENYEQFIDEAFFIDRLSFNLDLLNFKLSWLNKIDSLKKENQFEFLTAFDSVVTHLRAILLEKGKKNHTLQRFFEDLGNPDIAKKINDYLDEPFDAHNSQSIRTALKFISDKFICHFDNVDAMDLGNANYIMGVLSNPYSSTNLNRIFENITRIINENQSASS